ncbi:hypothetical protein SAMN05216411_11114 [Nitrosospira multiformis]|nr:hypothetical protein SAMN05216411_11114 [Nitrosospira multiformis]
MVREALIKSRRAGYKLADILIAEATTEQIAECAGVLALKLAHYQLRHGELRGRECCQWLTWQNQQGSGKL